MNNQNKESNIIKPILVLLALVAFLSVFAIPMGLANALNTMMNTAYRLLIDTTLYIMAVAVIAGALSSLLLEYGVVDMINRFLSPLMKPLFGLPGAAALGIVTTYLSDNPAIITLANNEKYKQHFAEYQIPALTNLGTAFGMGFIVSAFMAGISLRENVFAAVLCGNLGATIGSIVSTRLMLRKTEKSLSTMSISEGAIFELTAEKGGSSGGNKGFIKLLNTLTSGGKNGVDIGLSIIPGVLIICTFVMMLTYGVPASGQYTGSAYEGIGSLPLAASKIAFILKPLFGFTSDSCIAVPITALGSAGAALSFIPSLVSQGLVHGNDIAVFTAMCMCWSGYLSTHVSMMEVLGYPQFTGSAIISHTVGGICAGISAHWIYTLLVLV